MWMLSCLVNFWNICIGFADKMDVFSLEEEDCGGLFLTQQSSSSQLEGKKDEENEMETTFLGLRSDDFQSPCASLVTKSQAVGGAYSDISEEECEFEETEKHADVR